MGRAAAASRGAFLPSRRAVFPSPDSPSPDAPSPSDAGDRTRRAFERCHVKLAALALVVAVASAATRGAHGGPVEARRAWKVAQSLRSAPWRQRLTALRVARREANDTDPLLPRILAAEGSVLRAAGYGPAADASEAQAADTGPARDSSRLARMLSVARGFDAEGDERAALERLADVLAGAAGDEHVLGPALVLRARIAAIHEDGATLATLVRTAATLGADRVGDRLIIIDLAGLVRWRAGDRPGARRALEEEKRLYADAVRRGDDVAKYAARAWLRLELPRLLDLK